MSDLKRWCSGSVLLVLLALWSPGAAVANTYKYTYSGVPFSVWFDSGCPPECSLSGWIDLSQPLLDNLPWQTPVLSVDTILGYSFTDGLNTYDSANSSFTLIDPGLAPCNSDPCVATNAFGGIISWGFALVNTNGVQMLSEGLYYCGMSGCNTTGHDSIIVDTPYGFELQAGASAPGMWSGPNTVTTPEPGTLLLTGITLLTLVVFCTRGTKMKRVSVLVIAIACTVCGSGLEAAGQSHGNGSHSTGTPTPQTKEAKVVGEGTLLGWKGIFMLAGEQERLFFNCDNPLLSAKLKSVTCVISPNPKAPVVIGADGELEGWHVTLGSVVCPDPTLTFSDRSITCPRSQARNEGNDQLKGDESEITELRAELAAAQTELRSLKTPTTSALPFTVTVAQPSVHSIACEAPILDLAARILTCAEVRSLF